MPTRVILRSPLGGTVVRDIVAGRWEEPSGDPGTVLGEGMWALPGLVDAHAHLAAEELDLRPGDYEGAVRRAGEALDSGVTLILDKGWSDLTAVRVLETVQEAGRPDIEAAGRMIAVEGGYYPGFAREVGPPGLRGVVDEEARAGAGWVKMVGDWPRKGLGPLPNFTGADLKAAVETAVAAGCKVAIHTMAPDVPGEAVAAGVHSIEHGLFLTEDDIGRLGSRGGMWVPTVARVESLVDQLGPESSGGRLLLEGLANLRSLLPLAGEAGVAVLAGTDLAMAPAGVASEAMKLAEYGMSPSEAVRALGVSAHLATGRAAAFEPGTPANAVLFAEDPTAGLGVLAHPSRVVRLGVVR